ncbi:ATP-dependent protease ATPase subunit HslU [Poriferisphaera corsica]|uniref:ATP-dependent protease ATPase subunit HslU n=1 Tax=Poriferisphaera corsica TaxID=2528020 RepID=A0A517YUT2_9BACT|nr:ATP-dependent protease ATPase subunit HslU [Poriferisphaera corsica]QDU33977.1 ATP-dependent protease ATPase subunit HslU [Poriferisphaera corsica]
MINLTPKQIVSELDKYIVGQDDAKRSVAIAIRNRWRRQQLDPEIAHDISPKNIIMSGPTGVGKTEIARRLATLTDAPFIKVEASKFTEVGYHGRDVESMIRDLLDQAISMTRSNQSELVSKQAAEIANEKLVDLLLPGSHTNEPTPDNQSYVESHESEERKNRIRERLMGQLKSGALDDKEVEIHIKQKPQTSFMLSNMGLDQMDPDLSNMFEKMMPENRKNQKLTVKEAREVLIAQETDKLVDQGKITSEAIEMTESSGIIFLDEIDKIAATQTKGGGSPDVSRQGVQRDLLPIVEGSAVNTKHGIVHTDHILFIAAGAFHTATVNDLMPELQGRFPIRVELSSLGKDDFVCILKEPKNALTKQQKDLLAVEGLDVNFTDDGIDAIADLAADANAKLENIGARRLMTIIEKVFEDINFDAPEIADTSNAKTVITGEFVRKQLDEVTNDLDLSRFVL